MPTFQITAPDGKRYRVSGENAEGALAALKKMTGGAAERQDSFQGAGSFLTSLAEGVPIAGPAILGGLQKTGAYGRTLRSGRPYEEELATVRDMTERAQEEHPYLSTAGSVAGTVAGLAPIAATGAGAAALGLRGGSLLARGAAGAASGAGIGAADSGVRSEGDPTEIAKGAGFGAAGGAAGPYVGQVIGAVVRRGLNIMARPGGPLSSVSRRAAGYAADTAANPARVAAMQAELQRLGPEATLADVSPEWMGVARGAAARPGSRDEIVNFLQDRGGTTANRRLGSDLDASLGPVRNPTTVEAGLAQSRDALSPEYERVLQGARAVDTQALANDLDARVVDLRGPAQQAVEKVRGYLNIPHTNALDPNPRALLATRNAIDGLLDGEVNSKVIGELTAARRQVDAELARAVPGVKDVDAQFSELARQSEGLTRGGQVLDSGKTAIRPEDLAAELQLSALPQGRQIGPSAVPVRVREGARVEIDRIAGVNSNDPAALQKLVKGEGDWNRDKLRILFGPRADDALDAIDRETTFYRTANRVTSGSDTAMAAGFRDFLNEAATPRKIPTDLSVLGTIGRGTQETLGAIRGNSAERNAERFAGELGKVSIATGPNRDMLINAIRDYATRRAAGQPVSDRAARLAQMLLMGGVESQGRPPLRVHLNAGERDRTMGR